MFFTQLKTPFIMVRWKFIIFKLKYAFTHTHTPEVKLLKKIGLYIKNDKPSLLSFKNENQESMKLNGVFICTMKITY